MNLILDIENSPYNVAIRDKVLLWNQTIIGEPASKSNSRKLVTNRRTGMPMFIKSAKAREYEEDFIVQVKRPAELILRDVLLVVRIFYATRRSDLDESHLMDCLEVGKVIGNDRQIRKKFIEGFIDAKNPRAEIELWSI